MRSLMVAFERRGYAVNVTADASTVTILGTAFKFALIERHRQRPATNRWGSATIELVPSGILRLRIGDQNAGFEDDAKGLVEAKLNKFVANLVRRAVRAQHQAALSARRQQELHLFREQSRKERQALETERLRQQHVLALASKWAEHEHLRVFIDAVEAKSSSEMLTPAQREHATRWIAWSRAYCAATNPTDIFLKHEWPEAKLTPEGRTRER